MTEHDHPPDSAGGGETPEISEVRRLLGQARHTEAIPTEVAARMEAVLAQLRTESGATPAADETLGAPVISISAHRRRRGAALLVAAAAIVVGGVVIAQDRPGSAPSNATAGGAQTEDNAAGGSSTPSIPQSLSSGSTSTPPKLAPSPYASTPLAGLVVVRPAHFGADAQRGQRLLLRHASFDAAKAIANCVPLSAGSVGVPAEYRRAPAVLVYRPAEGSSQVVDLFVCGTSKPVRSITLPTP